MKVVYTVEGIWLSSTYIPPKLVKPCFQNLVRFCESQLTMFIFEIIPCWKCTAESRAIARYVSDKYEGQGTPLLGKTEKERALVNQWLEVESQNYYPVVSSIAYQLVFGPRRGLKPDEKVVEQQLEKFEKVLDIYEEHLAKNEYLAGNFFSLADLSHIPFTYLLLHQAKKGEGITSRKHVKAWWDKISSRPSWKQLLDLRAQS